MLVRATDKHKVVFSRFYKIHQCFKILFGSASKGTLKLFRSILILRNHSEVNSELFWKVFISRFYKIHQCFKSLFWRVLKWNSEEIFGGFARKIVKKALKSLLEQFWGGICSKAGICFRFPILRTLLNNFLQLFSFVKMSSDWILWKIIQKTILNGEKTSFYDFFRTLNKLLKEIQNSVHGLLQHPVSSATFPTASLNDNFW